MGLGQPTRVLSEVFKQTGGLVWKIWPLNHTRRANAKARNRRIQQVEAILRLGSQPPASDTAANATLPSKTKLEKKVYAKKASHGMKPNQQFRSSLIVSVKNIIQQFLTGGIVEERTHTVGILFRKNNSQEKELTGSKRNSICISFCKTVHFF